MNTKILLIKFSRTSIKDYGWLIKADNVEQQDYCVLEKIFSEYKSKQTKENNVNCGLIELSSYFYFFSCYKTIYTDNYNREIFSLDALCIKKENIDIICALYFIFFSNPQKYIQHEIIQDEKYCKQITNNFFIDVSDIFDDYLLSCSNIDKNLFSKVNFYPTFQGFDNELKTRFLQIIENKNISTIPINSSDTTTFTNAPEEKKCTLNIIETKKYLFGKLCKYTIKGDFNCDHNIIYIEKFFSCTNDLQNYINEITKTLDGYNVTVNQCNIRE